jgi:hypothetical protein
MRAFWPVGEAAQADYEALRVVALSGGRLEGVAAARFERRGLVGLIAWPVTEALFTASVSGAARPPWTPYADPRVEALATVYEFVLGQWPRTAEAVGEWR